MSTAVWGALLGAVAGLGLLLVVLRVSVLRRPQLAVRVLPYVRDVPRRDQASGLRPIASSPTSAAAGIFGPMLRSAAEPSTGPKMPAAAEVGDDVTARGAAVWSRRGTSRT